MPEFVGKGGRGVERWGVLQNLMFVKNVPKVLRKNSCGVGQHRIELFVMWSQDDWNESGQLGVTR